MSYNPGILSNLKDWQAIVSKSLLDLTLSNCAISNVKNVTKILKSAPNLQTLDLSGNDLEIDQELAESLSDSLRTLLLSECRISASDPPVWNLEQLVRLDLSNTSITNNYINQLANSQIPSIEVLVLDDNKLQGDALKEIFQLKALKTLKILSVKRN